MNALRLIGLLLRRRAAVVVTDARAAGNERVSAEVVFNRASGEFRVLTNMGRAVAEDVQLDLTRCATREGSHVYALALGTVLGLRPAGEPS